MRRGERGITLMEILVATVIAVVVAIGIGALSGSQRSRHVDLLGRGGITTEEGQAALAAALRMAKDVERADRIRLVSSDPGNIQLRRFEATAACGAGCTGTNLDPCCFDLAANYRWDQYRLTGTELRFYGNTAVVGCSDRRRVARDISSLTFTFPDESPAPPGGEAAASDNNVIVYRIIWDDGTRQHEFDGQITSRVISYSRSTGQTALDSGRGIDVLGVSDPPPSCT